nr:7050_t:CDS:10 [Entrophospora candida]
MGTNLKSNQDFHNSIDFTSNISSTSSLSPNNNMSKSRPEEYELIEKNIITSQGVEELFDKVLKLSSLSSPSSLLSAPTEIDFQCYGLFAQSNISLGNFIAEYKGEVCLKSDYKDNPTNGYKDLGTTKPYVLFYPTLDLCVDARRYGTYARFVRRSCNPNAETRTMYINDGIVKDRQLHLGIFAKCDIMQNQEITVGWNWDNHHVAHIFIRKDGGGDVGGKGRDNDDLDQVIDLNKRIQMGTVVYNLLKFTECACEDKNNCVIEKMKNYAKKPKDDLTKNKEGYYFDSQQSNIPYNKRKIQVSSYADNNKNNDDNDQDEEIEIEEGNKESEVVESMELDYVDRNKYNNRSEMKGINIDDDKKSKGLDNSSSHNNYNKIIDLEHDTGAMHSQSSTIVTTTTPTTAISSGRKSRYVSFSSQFPNSTNPNQSKPNADAKSEISSLIDKNEEYSSKLDFKPSSKRRKLNSFKHTQINLSKPSPKTTSSSLHLDTTTKISNILSSSKSPILTSPTVTTSIPEIPKNTSSTLSPSSQYHTNKTFNPTIKALPSTITTTPSSSSCRHLETLKTTNTSHLNIYPNKSSSINTNISKNLQSDFTKSQETTTKPNITINATTNNNITSSTAKTQSTESKKKTLSLSEYKQMKVLTGSSLTSKTEESKKPLIESQSNNTPSLSSPSTTLPMLTSITSTNSLTTTNTNATSIISSTQTSLPPLSSPSKFSTAATEQQSKTELNNINKIEEMHSSTPDSQIVAMTNDGYFPVDFNIDLPITSSHISKSKDYLPTSYEYHTSKDIDSINQTEYRRSSSSSSSKPPLISPRGIPPPRSYHNGGGGSGSGSSHYRVGKSSSGGHFRGMPTSPGERGGGGRYHGGLGNFNSPDSSPVTQRHGQPILSSTINNDRDQIQSIDNSDYMRSIDVRDRGWGTHDRTREWREREREREECGKRNEDYRLQRFLGDDYRRNRR